MRLPLLMPFLLLLAMFSLPGCNEAQIARAEAAVTDARKVLQLATEHEAQALDALAQAHALAERLDSEQGKKLIEQVQAAAARASELVPIARAGLDQASAAVEAAKKSQANGDSTWSTIGAVVLALVTGAGGQRIVAGRAVAVTQTALSIVSKFAAKAAASETDDDVKRHREAALNNAIHNHSNPAVARAVAQALPRVA